MNSDIEHQLAGPETEDVKPPDSSPGPDHKDELGSWLCIQFCGIFSLLVAIKVVEGLCIILAIAVAVAVGVAVVSAIPVIAAALAAIVVAAVMGLPVLIPLGFIIVFSLPKKTAMRITKDYNPRKEEELAGNIAGMYDRARWKEPLSEKIMMGSFGVIARASLAALVWLGMSLLVPRLRAVALLGSPMWKWSLLGTTLTAGYFQALTLILPIILWPGGGTTFYYLNVLLLSINHVAYFGLVLGTWLAYFRTHHGLNKHHDTAFEYVTWSIVSLFVGSILLLFKNLLLVKWSADVIYRRFEPRILITSLKFYFIGLLAAGFNEEGVLDGLKVLDHYGSDDEQDDAESGVTPHTNPKRFPSVSKYVMSRKMSLFYLGYVSRILISLGGTMSALLDGEGDHDEVVNWFKQQFKDNTSDMCTLNGLLKLFSSLETGPKGDVKPPVQLAKGEIGQPDQLAKTEVEPSDQLAEGEAEPPNSRSLMGQQWNVLMLGTKNMLIYGARNIFMPATWNRFMPAGGWNTFTPAQNNTLKLKAEKKHEILEKKNKKLANVLLGLVGEECSHAFTFDDLKIWMVDAHKDCINMGRTLADAKAIVTRLDIFMSFIIFVMVILLWLLITGLSSTTVLVTVATPFLALTFIFGDSAKTFFQGFIFCFATHPFDVGDRCILDGVELEVKKVSILTTTFIKIGSKEKRLYPNSILATKAIVNLGWQPDPKDMVELPLSHSTDLEALEKKITRFFEEKSKRYGNTYSMMISEVGENIKVKIHFSHILTVHDLSHSQCFKKKSSQRSDFLSIIKKYVNESRIEQMDAKNPFQSSASTIRENIELANQNN